MPFLHHLEMLSNSTCSELCFSDSSQSYDTCSLSSSPSDLAFDTVSQPPSDALLAADAPIVATVALPREDPRVVLTPISASTSGISTISDGHEEVCSASGLSICAILTSSLQPLLAADHTQARSPQAHNVSVPDQASSYDRSTARAERKARHPRVLREGCGTPVQSDPLNQQRPENTARAKPQRGCQDLASSGGPVQHPCSDPCLSSTPWRV